MEEIKKFRLADNQKAVIRYCDYPLNPREDWSNIWKMAFRPNREYRMPNEIDFDFLAYDDLDDEAVARMDELQKDYYVFFIDVYIHGSYAFSLSWEWVQCRRDTARNAGMICVPKAYNWYDLEEWSKSTNKEKWSKVELTREEAYKIAKSELNDYDACFNGQVYDADIYVERTYKCIETGEISKDREYVESTWSYIDMDDLEDFLKTEYNNGKDLEEM